MAVLLPAPELKRIVQYKQESDGYDGDLAYVEPADDSGSTWVLAYDPVDTFTSTGALNNPEERIATLVHEYVHVLLLNDTQVIHVRMDVDYIECTVGQTVIDEGCAKTDSYLTTYINEFWNQSARDAANQAYEENNEEDFAYDQYTEDPDTYVTEYAATNAIEDISESFAFFVMRDSIPSPATLAEEKMMFFYKYSDLTELRTHMREDVVLVLGTL